MAMNFKISRHQNSGNLHLKLMGDFDGTSAFELINTLDHFKGYKGKIFIHTNCLNHVDSFGKELFKKKNSGAKTLSIIFTGEHAADISPENVRL